MADKATDKIIAELLSYNNSAQNILFNKFLEERINELRICNDTADTDAVKTNQGAIKELKRILKVINKPDSEYITESYDGRYV